MPGDYSEELVERCAEIICDGFDALPDDAHRPAPSVPLFAGTTHTPPPQPPCADCVHVTRSLLDALSSSGRLVPEGSEVREEFAARLERSPDGRTEIRAVGTRAVATEIAEYYDGTPRTSGGTWRWSASVVQRRIITTPWSPAEPAQETPNA